MIHLNIGSNLDSKYGSKFDNISLAIYLLINSKIKVKRISNFYETPSYPNNNFPKFLNVGLIIDYNNDYLNLLKIIKTIEKKIGRIRTKKDGMSELVILGYDPIKRLLKTLLPYIRMKKHLAKLVLEICPIHLNHHFLI